MVDVIPTAFHDATPRTGNMDNVDLQVIRTVRDWRHAGHRVVLATVTRTWGSAPRPVGSVVAVRGDGLVAGSVSVASRTT